MDSYKVALIDETGTVPTASMQQYAAALQRQVTEDLAPFWDVQAGISVLAAGDSVPADTWPLTIVSSLTRGGPEEEGVHLNDQGQPYAQVVNNNDLTTTLSHELLEMLVDPLGTRMRLAANLDRFADNPQVSYLVEVCDPCEVFSYPIDGVPVSDFILPSFFDSNAAGKVDFLGQLRGPLPEPLPDGCYISWLDQDDQTWYEELDGIITIGAGNFGDNPRSRRDCLTRPARHDLAAIYRSWPKSVRRCPRPGTGGSS